MRGRGISAPDPFVLDDSIVACWRDTNGRAQRSSVINTAIRNLVLITAGQSNRANDNGTLFTPTNASAIDNFNIYDGACYDCAGPMLGPNYNTTLGPGNIAPRVADLLVTNNKFDRVILVPIAVGGTLIANWATGVLSNRTTVAMSRLASRGIVPGLTNVTFAFEWGLGESDGPAGTTQSDYQTGWDQVQAATVAAGFLGRFFVALESYNTGTTYSAIRAAQAAVVDGATVFQSGDLDTLTSGSRQADNLHFSTTGAASAATLIYNAMAASGAPF